ncbi:hypothetical protein KBY55_18380 [Streptomyces sp. b94]|nr:hypothetical protein [Streptomyces sp. b94]
MSALGLKRCHGTTGQDTVIASRDPDDASPMVRAGPDTSGDEGSQVPSACDGPPHPGDRLTA